ncbi:hypothetical protein KFE25_003830 [Diacronema lutheri]|uniref:Lipid desaturase domain-containing protein n=1 Tax=Diacronema lutheri TaxID=2081491 RepID=A0A8J5XGL8_DIALT|nr:hypothetical protein KFE25_003830 [Diacronema lutheri]
MPLYFRPVALLLVSLACAQAVGLVTGSARAAVRSAPCHLRARPTLNTGHEPPTRTAAIADARANGGDARGRTAGPQPELAIPGDTLETLPMHVVYTLACSGAVLALVCRAAFVAPAPTALALGAALLLGDFLSSLIHWATDNYGDINTPLVGTVCAAFQGHHKAPWTITYRSFYNNVHKIAKTALPAVALGAACLPPVGAAFFAATLYTQVLAQELHRWSHCLPAQLAPWQLALQNSRLVLSRRTHLLHHAQPFDAHYAILLGVANPIPFYRWLEARVYAATGVEANCWREEKGGDDVRARALARSGAPAR